MNQTDPVMEALQICKELTAFCSQNGWIINDSIHYEMVDRDADSLLLSVTFLESIMEGSGCQADQKPCYGRLRLLLNDKGDIIGIEIP